MSTLKRGDLIKLNFDNTKGHEQANYRRALVVSPEIYNKKVGHAIVCSITNQKKEYPFEVDVPPGLKVTGVILTDQVRTIDWIARKVHIVDHVPDECILEVQEKLTKLIL